MKPYSEEEYNKIKPIDKWVAYCPFCSTDRAWNNDDRLIRENDNWFIIYPTKPCGGVHRYKKHLILIPKKHHINTTSFSKEELLSKHEAEIWLEQYFTDQQYCSFVRHTDEIKSIQHLHYHYFWGNIRYRDIAKSLLYYDKMEKKEKVRAKNEKDWE